MRDHFWSARRLSAPFLTKSKVFANELLLKHIPEIRVFYASKITALVTFSFFGSKNQNFWTLNLPV